MATLAEQLKHARTAEEVKNIARLNKEKITEKEREQKERQQIKNFLMRCKRDLIYKISKADTRPRVKVKTLHQVEYLDLVKYATDIAEVKNGDLWVDFVSYFNNEGLDIRIEHNHDGMGVKSWLQIVADLPSISR